MTVITIYSLFGDDVRTLAFDARADNTFNILTIISFVMFLIEILLQCIAKEEYWLGFYFWLDLVSTLSLITDIGWIMDALLGINGTSATNAKQA